LRLQLEGRQLGVCTRRFSALVQGFTVNITGPNLVGLLSDNKDAISTVELPKTASIAATQMNPPWGVDRIDQNPGGATLDSRYTYNYPMDGTGVHVYILDTVSRLSKLRIQLQRLMVHFNGILKNELFCCEKRTYLFSKKTICCKL
jgi:hypothetical protein